MWPDWKPPKRPLLKKNEYSYPTRQKAYVCIWPSLFSTGTGEKKSWIRNERLNYPRGVLHCGAGMTHQTSIVGWNLSHESPFPCGLLPCFPSKALIVSFLGSFILRKRHHGQMWISWPPERDRSNWWVNVFSFSFTCRKMMVCMVATCMASVTTYRLLPP